MGNSESRGVELGLFRIPLKESNTSVDVFAIDDGRSGKLEEESIRVVPDVDGGIVGLKLWPGSLELSEILVFARPDLVEEKRVLELGCGVGLAGLSVAKHAHAKSVVLTDRKSVSEVVSRSIAQNTLNAPASFETFDWGDSEDLEKFQKRQFDIVIGSELVYAEEQAPLKNALEAVVTDLLVLAYTQRTDEDRAYLDNLLTSSFSLVERIGGIFILQRRRLG
jgi:hypothetical protein